MFRNLLHVIKKYTTATLFNVLGLSVAFFFFMLVMVYYHQEYGFDRNIKDIESIYKMENKRDDGIWDGGFSYPMAESILNASTEVQAFCFTTQFAFSAGSKIGFSTSIQSHIDTRIYQIEKISPQYAAFWGFEMTDGSFSSLTNPGQVLIPASVAKELYDDTDPIGKSLYIPEFKGSIPGIDYPSLTIGGVYKDFPKNTRLSNSIYVPIQEREQAQDWNTCNLYYYARFPSADAAQKAMRQFKAEHKDLLVSHGIEDIRLRPVTELYFGPQVRNDAAPVGNKALTDILLMIGILVIVTAMANNLCFSVALAPVRTKSVVIRKVLGNSDAAIRRGLLLESVIIALLAYGFSLLVFWAFFHSVNPAIALLTGLTAIAEGLLSGLYPAFYITSFPAIKALNGTFTLSNRSKILRKGLIGFQFILSIALVSMSLFVFLQNNYINEYETGFEHDGILEVKTSMSTAITQHEAFRSKLLPFAEIKEVSFSQVPMVSDMTRPMIGYDYKGRHSYMNWTGVSSSLPELFGIRLLCGRAFRPSDDRPGNDHPVCIINEKAAKEMLSCFPPEESNRMEQLLGTSISDNGRAVEIVGVMEDLHYESLYKEIKPFAFWTAPDGVYRSKTPGNFAYVKVAAGASPADAIKHIRQTADELNPGYPVDIHFIDQSLENLYVKSKRQGMLVASLSLIALLLSLVGVFGMAIFEAKRMRKEIAIRKVWGASIAEILKLFSFPVLKIILVSAFVAIPAAYYGVSVWLKGFAYHIHIHAWVFALAVCIVAFIAMATILGQNHKAASANPKEIIS